MFSEYTDSLLQIGVIRSEFNCAKEKKNVSAKLQIQWKENGNFR